MAHALCSVCGGEINTQSSPAGKCVRCLDAEARQLPLAPVHGPAELPVVEEEAPTALASAEPPGAIPAEERLDDNTSEGQPHADEWQWREGDPF